MTRVVVEYLDRLRRINTELIASVPSAQGRRLVVLDDSEVDEDLVDDTVEVPGVPNERLDFRQRSGEVSVPAGRILDMAHPRSVPLTLKQAAAGPNIAVTDLPRQGSWPRRHVRDMRHERPARLTHARGECAPGQDARHVRSRLEEEHGLADASSHDCWCYKTEFVFTIDFGGLCGTCNEGDCPKCGQDDEDWLHG